MRISEIFIKNFKAIDMLKFKPTMVNVLTGRNNTGKTSLLEAIDFAYDDEVINDGYHSILNCPSSIINYHNTSGMIKVNLDSAKVKRKLEVTFERPSPENIVKSLTNQVKKNIDSLEKISRASKLLKSSSKIASETRSIDSQESLSYDFLIEEIVSKFIGTQKLLDAIDECLQIARDGVKTFLYGDRYRRLVVEAVNDVIAKMPDEKRKYLQRHKFLLDISLLPVFGKEFRQANEALISEHPLKKGTSKRNKPIFIRDPIKIIKQLKNDKTYSETIAYQIEKILKSDKLVPGLDRFNFDSLVFSNTNRDVQMESMGDGFKVLTGLLGSLLTQPESSIMLLEEPEVHMHPGYLRELATYLIVMAKSRNIQLFISTHSIDLIQNLLDIESLPEVNQEFVKSELSIFRLNRFKDTVILEKEKYLEAVENINELAIDLRGL
jgi:predicted ATP-dependent endonuclease of OLD family